MPRPLVQEIRLLDKTKAGFSSLNRNLSVLKTGFAALGAAVGVGGLTRVATESINAADEINNLSIRLGASTEALSQYKLVAASTGVEFKTLTTGMQRATRRISEAAQGTGEAKAALQELGLSAKDLNSLKPEQQFELIADAMGNVEKQSDKVRLAMRLFDTEGVALLQTMEGGSEAIRGLRQEADELGATLDKGTAQAAADANAAIKRLGTAFQGVGQKMVTALAPAVAAVANWLSVVIPKAVAVVGKAFDKLLSLVARAGQGITFVLSGLSNDLASAADALGADQIGRALRKTAQDYNALSNSFGETAVGIGKVTTAQSLLNGAMSDGVKLADFYDASLKGRTERERELAKLASAAAAREAARRKSIADYVSNLRKQAETLGFSNTQLVEYELRQLGASAATIQTTLSLQNQINAFKAQGEAAEEAARKTAELESFAEALTRAVNPAQEVADNLNKIEQAFAAGLISGDTYFEAITREMDKMSDSADNAGESLKKMKPLGEELGPVIADSFGDAITEGKKFSDVLKGLEKDIIRVLARRLITKPLTNAIGGFLDNLGGSFFSGRAVGGPVNAGQPYVVGENGPELFVPRFNGSIDTNTPGATINVMVQGVQDATSFVRNRDQVARAAGLALRRAQAAV